MYILNQELFNPHYIYNGLNGESKWDKYLIDEITEPNQIFLKDKCYTHYTEGTAPYKDFWDREEDKIINGFNIGDLHVPGRFYHYINYCPIYNKSKKLWTFPDFWDLDFDYYKQMKIAQDSREHLAVFKSRQKGFSLKDAEPLVYNLYFQRGSMNYLMAYFDSHASKTWNFAKHYMNHLNKYTDFYKSRNPDRNEFIKMAYEFIDADGRKTERGFLSELHKVVFKDSAEKGVGGAIDLAILEEGGVWPNLEDVLEYIKPATQDGDLVTGLILLYGSVGDLDKSKGLKEIFYNPSKHGFKAFNNDWSIDSNKGKECGYFIPEYVCMKPYIDEYGNSDIEASMVAINKNRDKEKKKNLKSFSLYRSQHPIYPEEGFMSRNMGKLPVELISKQLANVEGNNSLRNYGRAVKLQEIEGKIKIETLHNKKRFDEWPVDFKKHTEDLEGNIWIWEDPMPNAPDDLYIASTDSVDQDNLGKLNSDSLFSMYVYKRSSGQLNEYTKKELVASLVGRPELIRDIYEQAEYLEKLYNAKNLVENANVGIINYHNNRNTDRYLQDELTEIKGINPNSNVRRKKGYHPTVEVKNHGDNLIIQYLKEVTETEYDEKGEIVKQVLGIERIKDIGLLKEMLGYDDESNCDRLDAFRGCLLFEEALFKKEITVFNGKSPYEALSQRAGKVRKQTIRDCW